MKSHARLLWLLTFLFFLRVLGQALVAFFDVGFLPSMEHWYSGLLPYPILLPVQIVILCVQAKINTGLSRNAGYFSLPHPRAGRFLQDFAYVYAGAMILRYALTMANFPERRWFGEGTIPSAFHVVLAAYLFVVGTCFRRGTQMHLPGEA